MNRIATLIVVAAVAAIAWTAPAQAAPPQSADRLETLQVEAEELRGELRAAWDEARAASRALAAWLDAPEHTAEGGAERTAALRDAVDASRERVQELTASRKEVHDDIASLRSARPVVVAAK